MNAPQIAGDTNGVSSIPYKMGLLFNENLECLFSLKHMPHAGHLVNLSKN